MVKINDTVKVRDVGHLRTCLSEGCQVTLNSKEVSQSGLGNGTMFHWNDSAWNESVMQNFLDLCPAEAVAPEPIVFVEYADRNDDGNTYFHGWVKGHYLKSSIVEALEKLVTNE